MENLKGKRFITVTELPTTKASREQLSRLYTRYKFASEFCKNKTLLEVACGAGLGLGYLSKYAKKVIGGDIDKDVLRFAQGHYKNREKIKLLLFDAEDLPFKNESFDVLIFFEAIYYLISPEKFIEEAYRVLRNNGIIIICTVNKDWSDFNPSPYSNKYFSAPELFNLLKINKFKNIQLLGNFLAEPTNFKEKLISIVKKVAIRFKIIPKTMEGKAVLKRLFLGKLVELPAEITEGLAHYEPLYPISNKKPNYNYKILFAIGHKIKK